MPRFSCFLRPALALLLPVMALSGCGGSRVEKARAAIHAEGFAYSVEDFLRAAREGRQDMVGEFLAAGMNPNAADDHGVTAIATAAEGGHGHVVALLLAKGAKPNASAAGGQTALMSAAQSGDAQALRALLAAGADPQARDSTGISPLLAAVLAGQADAVRLLTEKAAESLDEALQLACVKGHTAVIGVLLDRGANFLTTSADGRTPLAFAAQHGHMEAVKLLRLRGAPVTALDVNLKSPADHAAENGQEEMAAYLREPDRATDPIEPETPPERLNAAVFPEKATASLPALAASLTYLDYRARRLPVAVVDVPEGDTEVALRLLDENSPPVTVQTGGEIPGTTLTVERARRVFIASARGQGRVVDASEALLAEPSSGTHSLAVKGFPTVTGEGCGFVLLTGSESPVEARRGDTFPVGGMMVSVVEITPLRITLEREDTKEKATILRPPAE